MKPCFLGTRAVVHIPHRPGGQRGVSLGEEREHAPSSTFRIGPEGLPEISRVAKAPGSEPGSLTPRRGSGKWPQFQSNLRNIVAAQMDGIGRFIFKCRFKHTLARGWGAMAMVLVKLLEPNRLKAA
jgi:hypothetical protein